MIENSSANPFALPPLIMAMREITLPLHSEFRIARGGKTDATMVACHLTLARQNKNKKLVRGIGHAVPYARYGESVAGALAVLRQLKPLVEAGQVRTNNIIEFFQTIGNDNSSSKNATNNPTKIQGIYSALHALSTALRMLEAQLGLVKIDLLPQTNTCYTISLASPEQMGKEARANQQRPLLKLKLSGSRGQQDSVNYAILNNRQIELDRVKAVRQNAKTATLLVDANESWTLADYHDFVPELKNLGVALIEQPFPRVADDKHGYYSADERAEELLPTLPRPIPICADESILQLQDLTRILPLYDYVNIKLDKAGGYEQALKILKACHAAKKAVMLGCMVGSSFAMLGAYLLVRYLNPNDLVDLDGASFIKDEKTQYQDLGYPVAVFEYSASSIMRPNQIMQELLQKI